MDFIELNLCDKVGKILIEAKKLYTGSSFCMFLKWMASDIFNEIIIGNSIYCSQAKTYVARCFETIIINSGVHQHIFGAFKCVNKRHFISSSSGLSVITASSDAIPTSIISSVGSCVVILCIQRPGAERIFTSRLSCLPAYLINS